MTRYEIKISAVCGHCGQRNGSGNLNIPPAKIYTDSDNIEDDIASGLKEYSEKAKEKFDADIYNGKITIEPYPD